MKPLLPTDSPAYLRRLVRELNRQAIPNGFYVYPEAGDGFRATRARMRSGKLEVWDCEGWVAAPSSLCFADPYGNPICASRHPEFA